MSHNVLDVGDVLGAETSKNKGNQFNPPLFLQAPKMWRRQNRIKGLARQRFFVARAAACRRRSAYIPVMCGFFSNTLFPSLYIIF